MKDKSKWINTIFIIGIIALILGIADPLEGSVVIAAGSVLIMVSSLLSRGRYRKIFLACTIMIAVGIFSLFYISSLGGYDPISEWWWNILILPYPTGWLISIIILIRMAIAKYKSRRKKME